MCTWMDVNVPVDVDAPGGERHWVYVELELQVVDVCLMRVLET